MLKANGAFRCIVAVCCVVALSVGCDEEPAEDEPAADEPQQQAEADEELETDEPARDDEPGAARSPQQDDQVDEDEDEAAEADESEDRLEFDEDELRRAAELFAEQFAEPTDADVMGGPPHGMRLMAVELEGESGQMFRENAPVRVALESGEDETQLAAGEFEEGDDVAECLIDRRVSYTEFPDQAEDDHSCAVLEDAYDQLAAPPAYSATEPERCEGACCDFESQGGDYETLNLARICFDVVEGKPAVEELVFRHHPTQAEDPRADLWSRAESVMTAVDRYQAEEDDELLREHLDGLEQVGVTTRVNTVASPEEATYEVVTDEFSPDQLVDCVLPTTDTGERVPDGALDDCELSPDDSRIEYQHWEGAGIAVRECEDGCCSGAHVFTNHSRAGVTGVCFSEEGPDYELESLIVTTEH